MSLISDYLRIIFSTYRDDRFLWFTIFAVLFSTLVYAFLSVPFLIIEKSPLKNLSKYKLDSNQDIVNLAKKSILLWGLNTGILLCFSVIVWPLISLSQINLSPFPGFVQSMFQIILFLIIDDTLFYFYHRLLHLPFLYEKVHRIHHSYHYSSVLAAVHFHPIEYLILSLGFFSAPIILGVNVWVFYFWILIRQAIGVLGHCGYSFPWKIQKFIPYHSGNQFHYLHHKIPNRNYGLFFDYWDRIFFTHRLK